MTAEQDIQKHEASSVAQGPGPGALQHTSLRGSHRYHPYERRDKKALPPLITPLNSSNPGDSSAGIALEGVGVDEVPTLVFIALIHPMQWTIC